MIIGDYLICKQCHFTIYVFNIYFFYFITFISRFFKEVLKQLVVVGILSELFAHVNSSWWSCILLYAATRLSTASLGYALVGYLCYYLRQRRSQGQGVNNKDILGVQVGFNWLLSQHGFYSTCLYQWQSECANK